MTHRTKLHIMTQTNKDKIIDLCSISHQMTWKSFYDYRSSICNKSHRARINLYHITAFFKMRHFLLKYLLSPVGATAWETDTRHLYAGSLGWKTRLICIMDSGLNTTRVQPHLTASHLLYVIIKIFKMNQ